MTSNLSQNFKSTDLTATTQSIKKIALMSIGCSLCILLILPSSSVASQKHGSRRKHATHAGATSEKHTRGRKAQRRHRGGSSNGDESKADHGPKSPEVIELFQKPLPTPEPEDFRRHLAPPSIPQGLTPTR